MPAPDKIARGDPLRHRAQFVFERAILVDERRRRGHVLHEHAQRLGNHRGGVAAQALP